MSIRQAALVSEQLNQEIGSDQFGYAASWWSNPPKARECEPTFTLDRQIAEARQEMGEDKWQRLQAEWAMPSARATDPSDLSPFGSSQSSVPIAGDGQ